MGETYAYAVGNIRACETRLLTRQDMEQLLALRDPAELMTVLREKGFGGADAQPAQDAEQLLQQETAALWDYLTRLVPDRSLYRPFWLRNDYHNLKAVIKGTLANRPYEDMLMEPTCVPVQTVVTAVQERSFGQLPADMGKAAAAAYDVLAHTADVPLCDAILDKAAMEGMLAAADQAGEPLLQELMQATVAYCDFKIALRCARAGKGADYLQRALCGLPQMSVSSLTAAAVNGVDAVLEYMEQKDLFGSRTAAEQFRVSPSAFERQADDAVMQIARKGRMQAMGAAPVLGYLVARETEIKGLHILFSGLRTGQSEDSIRERLRDLYV
ncbi:MAG: V-type ATPase subunit [Clostridia bacterium]|nr:V-type ATPase subunit [Clostridia bacterium]